MSDTLWPAIEFVYSSDTAFPRPI